MSDVISRQDVINALERLSVLDRDGMETMCKISVADAEGWTGGLLAAIHTIEDMPTAERTAKVLNIAHVRGYPPEGECGNCGFDVVDDGNYCPGCGARLEWSERDE